MAHQVKRISVVQQERVQWATPEVGDTPPEGADRVFGGLASRVIWDEGRPLDDQGHLESPQPPRGQARLLSPEMARASVASASI